VKRFRRFLTLWIGVGVLCGIAIQTGALERMPVERLDLQAKLLRAVIKFSTQPPEQLIVAILYTDETQRIAQDFFVELQKLEFNELPVKALLIASNNLETLDSTVNTLYITPGNASLLDTIASFTTARQIFSVTGVPEYVEAQKIALGFSEYKGKPQILLCLPVAKMSGHEFKNPNFLNLQITRKLRLIK